MAGPLFQYPLVRPFKAADLDVLRVRIQPAQKDMVAYFSLPGYTDQLERDPSFTLQDERGLALACAGITPLWENRAMAWALLGEDAGKHMVTLTRAVKRFLEACTVPRLEAYVDVNFPAATRWIEMLGFVREGTMKRFFPEGTDCHMYARVK